MTSRAFYNVSIQKDVARDVVRDEEATIRRKGNIERCTVRQRVVIPRSLVLA